VGTGLAILVQGHDFNFLYDGGSKDDKRAITARGNKNRLLAYLAAALGPSGPPACVPDGDGRVREGAPLRLLATVVLSHPHEDHGNLLKDVLYCYEVRDIWDAGVVNDTVFYRDFLRAVILKKEATFHTSASLPFARSYVVQGADVRVPDTIHWTPINDSDHVVLGENAGFDVLHSDGTHKADPNDNSLVLLVTLGNLRLLLMGDAESGPRESPDSEPAGVEAELLVRHRDRLKAQVLQVGHHGSKTSSRRSFLDAVGPEVALIGAGPHRYGSVVLPDAEVVDELVRIGATVLRTDEHDVAGCDVEDRVGMDDALPGGCDNWILETSVVPERVGTLQR
jgi:competence protein ComEC